MIQMNRGTGKRLPSIPKSLSCTTSSRLLSYHGFRGQHARTHGSVTRTSVASDILRKKKGPQRFGVAHQELIKLQIEIRHEGRNPEQVRRDL